MNVPIASFSVSMTKGATVGDNEVALDIAMEDFINSINLMITLGREVGHRT